MPPSETDLPLKRVKAAQGIVTWFREADIDFEDEPDAEWIRDLYEQAADFVAGLQLLYQPHALLPIEGQRLWRDFRGAVLEYGHTPGNPIEVYKTSDAFLDWLVRCYGLEGQAYQISTERLHEDQQLLLKFIDDTPRQTKELTKLTKLKMGTAKPHLAALVSKGLITNKRGEGYIRLQL